ncbi:MAG: DUF5777 family beta-barrel protein [Flavobacteriales bacterium]
MKVLKTTSLFFFLSSMAFGQSLKERLNADKEQETQTVQSTFKSTRIVTAQSTRTLAKGLLDFRMSHRFDQIDGGFYDLFGLDNAQARFAFDYGLTDDLMIGFGRSSYNKTYDANIKYRVLKQEVGEGNTPVTLAWNSMMELQSVKQAEDDFPFSGRLAYAHQLMIARKFSKKLSVQLTPTIVHFNLVEVPEQENTRYALGTGFRYKLSNRVSLNAEYYYRMNPDDLEGLGLSKNRNAIAIGFDIETGGHVFQLHFTNSRAMTDASYIDRTRGDISESGIYFGFNFTRTFKL